MVPSVGRAADHGVVAAAQRLRPGDPRQPDDRGRPAALARDPGARGGARRRRPSRAAPRCCAAAARARRRAWGVLRPRGPARRAARRAAAARARAGPGAGRRGGGERGRTRSRSPRAAAAVSVWSGDRARGERVARTLGAEVAWVNEHGHSIPGAAVRLAGHVDAHRLASQPTRLRSARWLPYDPALVQRLDRDRAALARPRERAPAGAAQRRGAARPHRGPARPRGARRLGRLGGARSALGAPLNAAAPPRPRAQRAGARAAAGRRRAGRTRPRRGGRRSAPGPTRGRSRAGSRPAAARP